MTTLLSISAQIAKLQSQAEALRESEKGGVIDRIRAAIDLYGISAQELGFGKSGRRAPAKVGKAALKVGEPKYRHPKTGKTWTGRGKPPAWIASSKNRDAFLIANGASTSASRQVLEKSAAKVATVGVPKYKDPNSDKTWTGRGKPPAWIAGVQDRDTYLIAK